MNADLLAMLGGAGLPVGGSNRRSGDEGKTILSFKAGKMTTELQPDGKYLVTGDPKRGEISMIYHTAAQSSSSSTTTSTPTLKLEWRDRRSRTVIDDLTIFASDEILFEKVNTNREEDRVYLLQYGSNQPDRRFFYWMQEKSPEEDEENVVLMNSFLSDLSAAASAAGDDDYVASQVTSSAMSSSDTSTSPQIDALSSILENLGMPPSSSSTNNRPSSTTATPVTATSGGGTLTLADLQGAMAGLVTSTPSSPSLTEILNPKVIEESGILSNPETVNRLLELLPENQRSESFLKENLYSAQCLESIKTLQSALRTGGNLQEILVNFQLDTSSLEQNSPNKSPIELFLDAVNESVKKEKKSDDKDDKEGEDTKMEEG